MAKVAKNEFTDPKQNYSNLMNKLSQNSGVRLRTYYYDCLPYKSNQPTVEEKRKYIAKAKFLHAMTRGIDRFQFRQGRLRKNKSGQYEQKGVDVLLAIDMVRLCSTKQIDTAVLITGDSDLVPAVEACKIEGAIVQIYYDKSSVSDELLNVCDERYEMDQNFFHQVRTVVY